MTEKPIIEQGQAMLVFLEAMSRGEVTSYEVSYLTKDGHYTFIAEGEYLSLLGIMDLHMNLIRSKLI